MTNKLILREADRHEIDNWDDIIARFDCHRVSHTTAWLRSLEGYFRGKALFLVYERAGRIVACLPGMLVDIGPLRLYGSPLPGWQTVSMGPVFDPEAVTAEELIAPLPRFLESNYGVHHIELMTNALDAVAMEANGFRGRIEYTFQAPLYPDDSSKTFGSLKRNARRDIRRAERLGLTVRFVEDESFIEEFYDQITQVFIRGGNAVPFTKKRIAEYFRHLKEGGYLLAAGAYLPDGETCIATALATVANKELVLWMWAHRTEYRSYNPTELMTWAIMQRAMDRGCTSFDLSGRGDFKAKFGASLKNDKIRWVRSRYRLLTVARDLAERAYRLQQSVRGRYARRSVQP
jgi:CelD/BcsL family acetyltransferase involved in cellulose biosynthesis